jgi:hypothetical protein
VLSEPCWTCQGDYCYLYGTEAWLGDVDYPSNLMTRVSVQGGGPYRLAYTLTHDDTQPNTWRVAIGSVDGSFGSTVLESLTNAAAISARYTELPFNVPAGTTAITVTFSGQVHHFSISAQVVIILWGIWALEGSGLWSALVGLCQSTMR